MFTFTSRKSNVWLYHCSIYRGIDWQSRWLTWWVSSLQPHSAGTASCLPGYLRWCHAPPPHPPPSAGPGRVCNTWRQCLKSSEMIINWKIGGLRRKLYKLKCTPTPTWRGTSPSPRTSGAPGCHHPRDPRPSQIHHKYLPLHQNASEEQSLLFDVYLLC